MIVARKSERQILLDAYESPRSEFIAIYGRRRIGKTYLVRETFDYNFTFSFAGVANEPKKIQLEYFMKALQQKGAFFESCPRDWADVFFALQSIVEKSKEKKKVIFLDELSWMAGSSRDHSFISALEFFWNSYASGRKDVLLIVSSSSTSWLINNVVHNKGGLYHRLSHTIALEPFTLKDCREYSDKAGLNMSEKDILEAYMIFGGIPYYWSLIRGDLSLPQNVDRLCFARNGELHYEFDHLYASLFARPESYVKIVECLGQKKSGLSREEISQASKVANNGDLTQKLKDLEACGFIREFTPLKNKKKGSLFQLIDSFTLFYFHFSKAASNNERFFEDNYGTAAINSWKGGAFERVCLLHTNQMKKALGIEGVSTNICSYSFKRENGSGHQIDLLIQRKDGVINLCEMKYCSGEYEISKSEYEDYSCRIDDFIQEISPSYSVRFTFVTPYGLLKNKYSSLASNVITMKDLFL